MHAEPITQLSIIYYYTKLSPTKFKSYICGMWLDFPSTSYSLVIVFAQSWPTYVSQQHQGIQTE